MSIGIYCILNKVLNKRYIGQSRVLELRINDHKKRHFTGSKYSTLKKDIEKYGLENFEFNIIVNCNERDLDFYERFFIKKYKTTFKEYGYNIFNGGKKGYYRDGDNIQTTIKGKKKRVKIKIKQLTQRPIVSSDFEWFFFNKQEAVARGFDDVYTVASQGFEIAHRGYKFRFATQKEISEETYRRYLAGELLIIKDSL